MAEKRKAADFVDAIQAAIETSLDRVHTSIPGKVVAYDPATQTAHVQPMTKRVMFDSSGAKVYESLPLLPYVPVVWPRAGGYAITMPLAAGDFVWVMFAENGLSEFLATGAESAPWDVRRHHFSHAVCIPGAYPDTAPLADAGTGGMMLGKDGSAGQIRIAPAEIKIGADASDFVALAPLVLARLQAITDAFNAHAHEVIVPTIATIPTSYPSTANAGPASAPKLLPLVVAPVAASMVKAK